MRFQILAKYRRVERFGMYSDRSEQSLGTVEATSKSEALRKAKQLLYSDYRAIRVEEIREANDIST